MYTVYMYTVYMYTVYMCIVYMCTVYMYTVYMYTVYMYTVYMYTVYMYTVYMCIVYMYTVYMYTVYMCIVYMYTVYMYTVYMCIVVAILIIIHAYLFSLSLLPLSPLPISLFPPHLSLPSPSLSLSIYLFLSNSLFSPSIFSLLLLLFSGDSQPALPYFTANPASIAVEGSIVSLQCDLSDSADNITVKWSVNNTELTVPAGNYAYGTNYELVISNFDDSLNGNYTCIAMTESWILRSATADVRKSFITANYDDAGIFEIHVTAQDNSELIIPCDPNYTGYPLDEVTFTWEALGSGADETNENNYIKSGTDARNKFRVSSNGTMVIANVMEDETYQCTIDIDTNEIYYRVKVVVEESPSSTNIPHIVFPPENVIANVGETVIFDCIAGGE